MSTALPIEPRQPERRITPALAVVPATASGATAVPVSTAPRRRVLSIRWIVTAAAVLLTALPVLGIGVVSERHSRTALARELETRLLLGARNLANASAGALLGDFPELTLQPIIRRMTVEQPELVFAVVLDHRGVVQGHPDARRLGRPFEAPAGLGPVARTHPLEPGETLSANPHLLVAASPVRGPDGRVIGTALVALERDYVTRTLGASRRQQALVLAVSILIGVAFAFVAMSHLLRPIGPLRAGLERIGRGEFGVPIAVRDRTELGMLADAMNDVARTLERAQHETIERERLAHEIHLAREIQRSLLPAAPFTSPALVIRGEQRAAAEVGGDAWDILPLTDGRVGVAIADVSGKGLAGCLVMAMLSALLRTLRHIHASPAALLAALDERLGESLRPGAFVTLFYAVVDADGRRVTWASAGHNPTLVYRRAGGCVERLASRGMPLAAVRGGAIRKTLANHQVELAPGDLIVQYTDAFTEAFAPDTREPFGLERVEASVARHGAGGVDAVITGLRGDVERWMGGAPPEDDETLVVIGRRSATDDADSHHTRMAADSAPLEWLAEAEARGTHLELDTDLDALRGTIFGWLDTLPARAGLDRHDAEVLGTAIYEVCANIAEHGYAAADARHFDLWWVPGVNGHGPAPAPGAALRAGRFVVRDDGAPFRPDGWKANDFSDPAVRRRGRGFGLEIIHRVMHEVVYTPGTSRGNITALRFGLHASAPGSQGEAA